VAAGRALVLCFALLAAACGGSDDGGPPAVGGVESIEAAYTEGYTAAWVSSCKKAVADIAKDAAQRAAGVNCTRPVEQMEGNTAYDPEQAKLEGRRQGTFDGCAYAWDEAFADTGEVEARC
jgi:hypothetical protein